jgi:rhodanese-related sulfurtransferase
VILRRRTARTPRGAAPHAEAVEHESVSADIQPQELRRRLASGEQLFLLDVREPEEVASWAFPGSVNIPLGQLNARIAELPTDRPIVVACHVGGRSAVAADALNRAGWEAINLVGGAVAWQATASDDG